MEPTGNPSEIAKLNELLGQELGRNPYGQPVFEWWWGEHMIWPAARTGRMVKKHVVTKALLIGGGEESVEFDQLVPEHVAAPQLKNELWDAWLIARWLSPWQLILGAQGGDIRYGAREVTKPTDVAVEEAWARQYPGTDFPAKGWRVPMGQTWPGGPCPGKLSDPPTRQDTINFVRLLKVQTALTFQEAMAQYEDGRALQDTEAQKEIEQISRDAFPAFLNIKEKWGKRGGGISFPWSRWDKR